MPPYAARHRVLLSLLLCLGGGLAMAASPLGAAQGFAVLGHGAVTNAHVAPNAHTQIYGNVGVAPGASITGFGPDALVLGGALHHNDSAAQAALAALLQTAADLSNLPLWVDLSGSVLGSPGLSVLTPGVYRFSSAADVVGNLELDFAGNPDAHFVFQIGTSLTTAAGSSVRVLNGGAGSGVYWQVGSAATLGAQSQFAGNLLAGTSVSLGAGAQVLCGRVFALQGAVTLIDNLVSSNCTAENFAQANRLDFGSQGFSGSASPVPEPSAAALWILGLWGLLAAGRRARAP